MPKPSWMRAVVGALVAGSLWAGPAEAATCPNVERVRVPGA
jgi:hypothetical protein